MDRHSSITIEISAEDLAHMSGVSVRTIHRRLAAMRDAGLLHRETHGGGRNRKPARRVISVRGE